MKHFTISEMIKSDVAKSHEILNFPTTYDVDNMTTLIEECLDVIREEYGKPIIVRSGYRCQKLNSLVKGSKTSQHMKGMAADIICSENDNKALLETILRLRGEGKLNYTQLISEYPNKEGIPSWIHISYDKNNLKNQFLILE